MIHFEEVNRDNWRLELKVLEEQKKYVSDSLSILARAYAYRDSRSKAFVIYEEQLPVGMVMYYDCDELSAYNLSQFFIDYRYQRRGYGLKAVKKMLELMQADGKYKKVILCYIDGDTAAQKLYEQLGFAPNGVRDGNEIVMEKSL